MTTGIRIDVYGTPSPKGSVDAFVRNGRAIVSAYGRGEAEKRLRAWEAAVRAYARDIVGERKPPFVRQALRIQLTFFIERPRSHFGTGKNASTLKPSSPTYPIDKPDHDKLARGTCDALTGIVWDDDSRVVDDLIRKRYAASASDCGATIIVDVMP